MKISEKKVIIAGLSCLDITPLFPREKSAFAVENILKPGTLIQMDGVAVNAGGAVSNTGLAMKLMGADTVLLTKTGQDDFAELLSRIYDKYRSSSKILKTKGERTSYSVVLAIPGMDRIFLHDPGCNGTFCFNDVKKADFSDTSLFHFGYPPLMKRVYENNGKELVRILKYVKEQGVAVSLDMAAIDRDSEAAGADWNVILKHSLPYVDFFVPSAEELCFMLSKDLYSEIEKRENEKDFTGKITLPEIKRLADICIEYGAKVVLIKCGAEGMFYKSASCADMHELSLKTGIKETEWGDMEGFEESFMPKCVLSATGAGDVSIAAFLVAMLEGRPLKDSVRLATAQGALCVENYGVLDGIKTTEELQERINAGWEKQVGFHNGRNAYNNGRKDAKG